MLCISSRRRALLVRVTKMQRGYFPVLCDRPALVVVVVVVGVGGVLRAPLLFLEEQLVAAPDLGGVQLANVRVGNIAL
jgi:hypothetical protein